MRTGGVTMQKMTGTPNLSPSTGTSSFNEVIASGALRSAEGSDHHEPLGARARPPCDEYAGTSVSKAPDRVTFDHRAAATDFFIESLATDDDPPMKLPTSWTENAASTDVWNKEQTPWEHWGRAAGFGFLIGLALVVPVIVALTLFAQPGGSPEKKPMSTVGVFETQPRPASEPRFVTATATAPTPLRTRTEVSFTPELATKPQVKSSATTIAPAESGGWVQVAPRAPEPATVKSATPEADLELARARRAIAEGHLKEARNILLGVAATGDPAILFALAETFDPRVLAAWNQRAQTKADPMTARLYYEGALSGGLAKAAERIRALE